MLTVYGVRVIIIKSLSHPRGKGTSRHTVEQDYNFCEQLERYLFSPKCDVIMMVADLIRLFDINKTMRSHHHRHAELMCASKEWQKTKKAGITFNLGSLPTHNAV
jgi:hypothetical protein